ncbi:hypothetical protein [Nakamurella multipartita]|uniref:hypothetical protein n=1 Tax=Nakamurella multipartita TaxID=53461 RepID=UPI00059DEE00|nr:hypothetical protein [Nakamurella multipartita]
MRLADVPAGRVLTWYSDDVTASEPYGYGWIDVHIEKVERGIRSPAWALTVVPPGDPDDCVHNVETEPDVDLHVVFEQEGCTRRHVLQCPVPRGGNLDTDDGDRLRARLAADPALGYSVVPAWTESAVTSALNSWIAETLGRPDLRFSWNSAAGPSPMRRRVEQQVVDARNGPTYDSGIPGVRIADGVMDTLLAIPAEDAAAVMEAIRDVANGPDSKAR